MSEAATLSQVAGPATVDADDPWPGLFPFREADRDYFQGRRAETEELLRLVMRERLTVLFGLSGLGKSSLLQAGLFPPLRRSGVFPVYLRLDFSAPAPDLVEEVKETFAREARASAIEAPPFKRSETLWEYFHRREGDLWNARNRPVTPLLVFDQFEELFTLSDDSPGHAAASSAFCEELADLVEGRPSQRLKARLDERPDEARAFSFGRHPYKILLSIREDFLPELESLRTRMPALALNRFRLLRMNGEAALRVVSQAPRLVDADVAQQVVRFVAADRRHRPLADLEVEPALLSVVCRELNHRRRSLGDPKITAGLLQGSQEQVLGDFYERSMADLPLEVRRFVEDHLLTVTGYRDSVALDNALGEPGVTREAIDLLVERRIVRREDRGGVLRLELTHDLLGGVVRASRDGRRRAEAAEQERRALLQAQEEEKRRRDLRDLKRTRVAAGLLLALVVLTATAATMAVLSGRAADEARAKAEKALEAERLAKEVARVQRGRAEAAVEMIQRSLHIRQAALSGDRERLGALLASLDRNLRIRFRATATPLGYKNQAGRPVYDFELFPDPGTLPSGPEAVAFITYLADHPTFRNTLMTTGPDRGFRASYVGWGALNHIVALIEYKDPTTPSGVAEFDQQALLGW